jgi:hypothetical protein
MKAAGGRAGGRTDGEQRYVEVGQDGLRCPELGGKQATRADTASCISSFTRHGRWGLRRTKRVALCRVALHRWHSTSVSALDVANFTATLSVLDGCRSPIGRQGTPELDLDAALAAWKARVGGGGCLARAHAFPERPRSHGPSTHTVGRANGSKDHRTMGR